MNYDDHEAVKKLLAKDQNAEEDLRQEIDEIMNFMHHPQGQWEDSVWNQFDGRPRYTFDMCKPIIASIWAEMAANEYAADIQPAGDGADEDVAQILQGMVRRMYQISSFPDQIAKRAGKRMIMTGFSCWRLVSQYCSPRSFYQDLKFIPVSNCHRRVWFDCNAELQTKEDAEHVFCLSSMSRGEADKKAKRNTISISDNSDNDSYHYKPEDVINIGEILYKKKVKKMIYLLDNGTVLDEDQIEEQEIDESQIVDERETHIIKVFSREFDGKGWIGDAKETVFSHLPVIPVYANFDITEDGKTRYEGVIRALMDMQRVFNYSESRKIEESVLAARAKTFMNESLAEGYEDELADINSDPRAIQLFANNPAENGVLFYSTPPPQPSPMITEISNDMIRNIQINSGIPNPLEQMNATNKDSDFRFEQRSSMGQAGTFEYYCAYQVALEYSLKVALAAFPRVYDTERKISIIDDAGQSSEVVINTLDDRKEAFNNILRGDYNVTINIGENFESRQAKTNDAILELGKVNPEIIMRNSDVLANNMKTVGMSTIADRERAHLMKMGVIPESQWTDEERQQAMLAAQQPKQPDPATILAEAEAQKAQAETQKVQTQALIEQAKLEAKQIETQANAAKADYELQLKALQLEIDNMKKIAETGKVIAETEVMVDKQVTDKQIAKQSQLLDQSQSGVNTNDATV